MTASGILVFLYGTLKRGKPLHHAMHGQQFVGAAVTQENYRLFLVAEYPGLVSMEPGQGVAIQGEVWRVTPAALRRLDEIECVAEGLYERRPVELAGDLWPVGGVEAWFYLPSVAGCLDCGCCFDGRQ